MGKLLFLFSTPKYDQNPFNSPRRCSPYALMGFCNPKCTDCRFYCDFPYVSGGYSLLLLLGSLSHQERRWVNNNQKTVRCGLMPLTHHLELIVPLRKLCKFWADIQVLLWCINWLLWMWISWMLHWPRCGTQMFFQCFVINSLKWNLHEQTNSSPRIKGAWCLCCTWGCLLVSVISKLLLRPCNEGRVLPIGHSLATLAMFFSLLHKARW